MVYLLMKEIEDLCFSNMTKTQVARMHGEYFSNFQLCYKL